MVIHCGLYVLALHVKETVVHTFSQGIGSPSPLSRLEDHVCNTHTLLRSFCKS